MEVREDDQGVTRSLDEEKIAVSAADDDYISDLPEDEQNTL